MSTEEHSSSYPSRTWAGITAAACLALTSLTVAGCAGASADASCGNLAHLAGGDGGLFSSSGGGRPQLEGVPFGVGSTPPNDLLVYHDFPGAPEGCKDPAAMLDRLEAAKPPPSSGCVVTQTTDGLGGKMLRSACLLGKSASGCKDYYLGEIWIERVEGSTVDYVVRSFGWPKRTCTGAVSYGAGDDVTEATRPVSDNIEQVLKPCRKPSEGEK